MQNLRVQKTTCEMLSLKFLWITINSCLRCTEKPRSKRGRNYLLNNSTRDIRYSQLLKQVSTLLKTRQTSLISGNILKLRICSCFLSQPKYLCKTITLACTNSCRLTLIWIWRFNILTGRLTISCKCWVMWVGFLRFWWWCLGDLRTLSQFLEWRQ